MFGLRKILGVFAPEKGCPLAVSADGDIQYDGIRLGMPSDAAARIIENNRPFRDYMAKLGKTSDAGAGEAKHKNESTIEMAARMYVPLSAGLTKSRLEGELKSLAEGDDTYFTVSASEDPSLQKILGRSSGREYIAHSLFVSAFQGRICGLDVSSPKCPLAEADSLLPAWAEFAAALILGQANKPPSRKMEEKADFTSLRSVQTLYFWDFAETSISISARNHGRGHADEYGIVMYMSHKALMDARMNKDSAT